MNTDAEKNVDALLNQARKKLETLSDEHKADIIEVLKKYKIGEGEARKFADGEESQDVIVLLSGFIQIALRPIVHFPESTVVTLLKNHNKAEEILLAMDYAVESTKTGLFGESMSTLGNFFAGKINDHGEVIDPKEIGDEPDDNPEDRANDEYIENLPEDGEE